MVERKGAYRFWRENQMEYKGVDERMIMELIYRKSDRGLELNSSGLEYGRVEGPY
jgi:hypothetical protein